VAETQGHLVIIGGAEDRQDAKVVLSTVAELAGGKQGRMVVLTTASRRAGEQAEVADEFQEMYERAFSDCGLGDVMTLHIHDRAAANDTENAGTIAQATGVFMTGGDQSRLVSILAGTAVHRAMTDAWRRGACVSGTSAGAAALSEHMAVGGPADLLPRKGMMPLGVGLGFLRLAVLDQHFSQRHRFARLLSVVAQNPSLLGVGIDEDTGLVVGPRGAIEVVGSGAVTVLDARDVLYTNVHKVDRGDVLALSDVHLHLLPSGFRHEPGFDGGLDQTIRRLAGVE
jgi:cyanophycinase